MIIGICGFIGSGKDTAADYLVNFHGFRRESFASALKDAIGAVFGWDRDLLEGRTKQAREWREQVDSWWSERLDIPTLTPRWVLQHWGTEVCRHGFHDDIWIASLENKIRTSQDDVVISDCRFPNEIRAIKKTGGAVSWIRRGDLPEWYNTALKENSLDHSDRRILEETGGSMAQKYPKIHASEWAWIGTDFDHIIDNNSSIEDLYGRLKTLVR